jgi:hypothetical protein
MYKKENSLNKKYNKRSEIIIVIKILLRIKTIISNSNNRVFINENIDK